MRLRYSIALAMVAIGASYASNTTSKSDLNGWYPCSDYTFSEVTGTTDQNAQCVVYNAPLCYSEICKTPEGVNPKVDIFVKRLPATAADPDTAINAWLLQGGPGASSTDLESSMVTLHSELNGTANVYTMDHRGTGRSTRLDCVASQATTTGSPWGADIDPSEVPACAKDLHTKYGDLASFSVTTAATDLATFITKFTNGAATIVYGVSYGTMLAERLMHLSPPEVTGYVLDGVASTSGARVDEFFYMSRWDSNFGEVGDAFLSLCEDDVSCKSRFDSKGVNGTLQQLIEEFDHDPNSTCAALVSSTFEAGESASFRLRSALGSALMDSIDRTLIPPVVYRLQRCAPDDLDILKQFFLAVSQADKDKTEDSAFQSTLLYNLIVYSEMMEMPLPPTAELKDRFTSAKISSIGGVYLIVPQYCAFSKDKSTACEKINMGNYESDGIIYKRDQYWNKTATIPNQASVLVLSGKLDPQTPNKYAEIMFKHLQGEKKDMIAFEYASHGAVATTRMVAGDTSSETCGMKVWLRMCASVGDLTRLDQSCVDKMPAFNLTNRSIIFTVTSVQTTPTMARIIQAYRLLRR